MHAVLEGVTKSLFNSWFDTKYHQSRFYLGRKMKEICKALLRIKPSYEFRRTPRSMHTSKYWKASEYRAWLLIYSIPVLLQVDFPADYLYHFSLLVSSIHILLGCNISQQHLQIAHCMLARFYELMPILYPQTMCALNFHSLIHMCEFVRRWGPLWCYSTFGFENFNGFLKRHCHGTRNVLPQLIQSVRMRLALPLLKDRLDKNENSQTVDFLNRVTGKVDRRSDVLGK